MSWNPQRLQATLQLNAAEVSAIQAKMPRAEDGHYYADAVFEGGGVKGTAFLGALRCFSDAGIRLRKVAGTSAGAITASLVAAQIPIDELEQIVGDLDYEKQLLSEKTSALIRNGSPEDDLDYPHLMLLNLLLARETGQYSSEPFYRWLSEVLSRYDLDHFDPVIGHQLRPDGSPIPWYLQRQLKIIISDISQGEMRILPQDLPKQYKTEPGPFSVAEAVRLSMSIPLFFEPGKLGDSTIVDGGILSNFPLWAYDTPGNEAPRCPTFGLMLTQEEEIKPQPMNSALGIFSNMMNTLMVARDRHYTRTQDHSRVIRIDTTGVTTTQFNLDSADKDFLYRAGYETTKRFLLDRWDWNKHLEKRGHRAKVEALA